MNVFPPPSSAPAGWYVDPEGSPDRRYFDGHQWWPVESAGDGQGVLPLRAGVTILAILIGSLILARVVAVGLVAIGVPGIVAVLLVSVIGYGPAVWWAMRVDGRHRSGRRGSAIGLAARPIDLLWGPLVWLVAIVVQITIAVVLIATGVPFGSNVEGLEEVDTGAWVVVSLVVTAVVMAPIAEEIVFRGVVQRALASRLSLPAAIVAQGLLFGLIHLDPGLGLGNLGLVAVLAGVGMAFGAATALIGRITPAIIAHAIFNTVVVVIVLSGLVDRLPGDDTAPVGNRDSVSVVDRLVVDQADVVDPGGDDHQPVGVGRPIDGLEATLIDDVEILDP